MQKTTKKQERRFGTAGKAAAIVGALAVLSAVTVAARRALPGRSATA